ncbi:MAG: SDR family oxidoreductase [Actinomycetota bacterium]|nr:SDR family oxidoreductase [Actinomycetota bacterium]
MQIEGATALVTGANRGIGRAFAEALRERGARRVFAGVRDPSRLEVAGVEAVQLDVTDAAQVAAAAARCGEVTLLVNNAGVLRHAALIGVATMDDARYEMEVHYFGTLALCRAFAPVIERNGGGAIVNMHSVVSFFTPPDSGSYAASKAAQWSLTNGVRSELAPRGIHVVGVHVGFVDTDMASGVDAPKVTPASVVAQALDAAESGLPEVLADETARNLKEALPRDQEVVYPAIRAAYVEATRG